MDEVEDRVSVGSNAVIIQHEKEETGAEANNIKVDGVFSGAVSAGNTSVQNIAYVDASIDSVNAGDTREAQISQSAEVIAISAEGKEYVRELLKPITPITANDSSVNINNYAEGEECTNLATKGKIASDGLQLRSENLHNDDKCLVFIKQAGESFEELFPVKSAAQQITENAYLQPHG